MTHWWKDEIIYQIYPKSFKDSNHDGIGDINGIRSKLDYLADLGITSIWICPVYQSPMIDNGYDISDYYAIDPDYGSVEDMKNLIKEANVRNIKIIMDLVVNHTSDEHEWFQDAINNSDSKYRDYYIFKEADSRPNNWRSVFGGSVWEKVPGESTYYYHTFDKKQPDLNWENAELREEIYRMIRYWLDLGVSGFRVDAITFIKKDLTYKNGESDGVDGLVKCTTMTRNYPGIEVFLNELKEETFKPYDAVTIAEAAGVTYDQLGEYAGEDGFFSMIFDFSYSDLDVASGSEWFNRLEWSLEDLFQKIEISQNYLQEQSWGAPFIENHDQQRAASKYLMEYQDNEEAVKAIALMYFFLRGTAFIYQGQELGMVNVNRQSINEFDDVSSIDQYYRGIDEGFSKEYMLDTLNYRSRDNARVPMQWSDEQYRGFSDVEPWLGVVENYDELNVENQMQDTSSVLNFYKQMIELKKSDYHKILNYGDIEFLERKVEGVLLYRRTYEDKSLLICVNLTNEVKQIELEKTIDEIIFGNLVESKLSDDTLTLYPFAAKIMKEVE